MSDQMTTIRAEFEKIQLNLRNFIALALEEDELSLSDFISSLAPRLDIKCWEEKNCKQQQCPAYLNKCGRCWIIAGTMCGGEVQGQFALKYGTCKECDIYQRVVFSDPVHEIEEHLIVLIHSLRCKTAEIKEISIKDHLTGLYNRRYFDTYIAHEFNKIKRSNSTITIMIIDINNFKHINDTFGHSKGDESLKICSNILLDNTRESDVVFRFGGDEFCIVMHEYSDNECYANAVISRIDAKLDIFNKLNDSGATLSLSYGYSVLTKTTDTVLDCINDADQKMYTDKKRKKMPARAVKGLPPTPPLMRRHPPEG